MARGRKPKALEQRAREGNPGKRPLAEPIRLSPGAPVKPVYLPPEAGWLWDEIVPVLDSNGILNTVDAAALTAMCVEWQIGEDARAVIEQEGLMAFGSTGQLVEHPAVGTMQRAHGTFLRFAEQYGLTPTARARIAIAAHGLKSMQAELDEL